MFSKHMESVFPIKICWTSKPIRGCLIQIAIFPFKTNMVYIFLGENEIVPRAAWTNLRYAYTYIYGTQSNVMTLIFQKFLFRIFKTLPICLEFNKIFRSNILLHLKRENYIWLCNNKIIYRIFNNVKYVR